MTLLVGGRLGSDSNVTWGTEKILRRLQSSQVYLRSRGLHNLQHNILYIFTQTCAAQDCVCNQRSVHKICICKSKSCLNAQFMARYENMTSKKHLLPRLLLLPCESFLDEVLLGTLDAESYLYKERATIMQRLHKARPAMQTCMNDTAQIRRNCKWGIRMVEISYVFAFCAIKKLLKLFCAVKKHESIILVHGLNSNEARKKTNLFAGSYLFNNTMRSVWFQIAYVFCAAQK